MTSHPSSTGHRAQDAVQASSETAVGAPEDAARQGVPCACGSDGQRGDGRYAVAWLHITAPPDWQAMPTATSKCACGRDRSAVGRRRALALIADHEAHKTGCPLRSSQEEKNAA
ncbi:hypothetical protein GCM10009548_11530 [Streptomyces malaysiensis subsp. malaysiensis]|uniref:Uncharacterized protein n=1 Tax=Streptomyces malaysiensis TaxID=92644 RepID=A0ABX6WLQ7_STRMQ|nr:MULTISPECIES: hypothetical protein [Streptomyces]QPI62341.1 hypothetical protein I1A49_22930 [Streptomyces solisilvae]UHH18937.1 hypothetical protein LUV23_23115 [Streptomyces sp. HNM0561]